jgi:hypothetical protein
MKKTESKLDLSKLQKQFDELLENFTDDDVIAWKVKDMVLQEEKLFAGKSIEVDSNPVSYPPVSCNIKDLFYRLPKEEVTYENAA